MDRIVAIGECMVELSLEGAGRAAVAYAGDTFNTAVYLSRLGASVSYATAVGKGDPFSAGVLKAMADEGLDASLVVQAEGRLPGLYAIERGPGDARRFHYWRVEAPARDFFRLVDETALIRALRQARLIYISGVTLAVIAEEGRRKLLPLLSAATQAGAQVALDLNYRPALWPSLEAAHAALVRAADQAAWLFLSAEDRVALGDRKPPPEAEVVERLADHTVRVRSPDGVLDIRPAQGASPVLDATGAGDAFNAGYLAARLGGANPTRSVAAARRLAEAVIARPGAIIPREAMPDMS